MQRLKRWAGRLMQDVAALHLAVRDPRTPWPAKIFATVILAYALSPIDLIPDVVPVIGYLDDLILIPLGLWAIAAMIPPEVMAECRRRAAEAPGVSGGTRALVIVALTWLGVGALLWGLFLGTAS